MEPSENHEHKETVRDVVSLTQRKSTEQTEEKNKTAKSRSNTRSRSSSSSSSSSAPQYSDDIRVNHVPGLGLLPSHSSASSSTKTCEADTGEDERDTFSPVSSNSPSDIDAPELDVGVSFGADSGVVTTTTVDNKIYERLPSCGQPVQASSSSSSSSKKHKLFAGSLANSESGNNIASTSKEEKQRHNEEIVIMETSSVSSETGSWESVFPQTSTNPFSNSAFLPTSVVSDPLFELKNCSYGKLDSAKEKNMLNINDEKGFDKNVHIKSSKKPILFAGEKNFAANSAIPLESNILCMNEGNVSFSEPKQSNNLMNSSGTSACFIDAYSLRDENEVLSISSVDEFFPQNSMAPSCDHTNVSADSPLPNGSEQSLVDVANEDDSPTKQLEAFHKSFAKCKAKSKDFSPTEKQSPANLLNDSSSSSNLNSNSEVDSPKKIDSEGSSSFQNNLSDEEKLWKNENSSNTCKVKDKNHPITSLHVQEDTTETSDSLAVDPDSSESSFQVKMNRYPERKHESFATQSNVIHFSVHPLGVSPKFTQHCAANSTTNFPATTGIHSSTTQQSDLSYTTDYSSSSPAPSLVWSEHEHRPSENDTNGIQVNKTCPFPDTPHNSIVHMELSSNNCSMLRDCNLSSSLSHQRDSGAYCSDATESPILIPRTPKRSKFDEANPIISGGASIKDFNIKQCESPPVKRRTDTCPIVSGGFVSLDFEETKPLYDDGEEKVELRSKAILRKPIAGIASWVVDMSDCHPERRKSASSSSSLETSASKFRERSDSSSSHKSGCGFYVPLDNPESKGKKSQMSKSYTTPNSNGVARDEMSQSDYYPKVEQENKLKSEKQLTDKKNIFSMFIDIGGKKSKTNSRNDSFSLPQRFNLSTTNAQKRLASDDVMKSSASSTETLMWKSAKALTENEDSDASKGESKSLDYRCNLDPPITVAAIRRLTQQRTQAENMKRHSWGTSQDQEANTNDCKRSISLVANNSDSKDIGSGYGLMSIIDKIPLISKASSLSVDSSLSLYDEYSGSKSGRSTSSNNSNRNSISGNEREDDIKVGELKVKKRRRDVQINETFDKSSIASITDGALSKDMSPGSTTDTDDLTFQQDEETALREVSSQQQLANFNSQHSQVGSNRTSAIVMETIIEAKEVTSPKKNAIDPSMESLHATIEKQKMLLETVNENNENEKSNFVKLSDMDKPAKLEMHSPEAMSKSVGNHRQLNRLFRDENKARPHSWTMTRSTGNSFLNITNSVDNLRSLSRLFPNFSKDFSNSVPNDMLLHHVDYIQTDLSADSSLASSFSRSGMDESSISCRQPRRLGEDLLKMFLQEIATDMIVEVHGRRIKAHKCILRSRCQYFAAMLAGSNAQSVVSLQGYSYTTVHFALCHIYSGASHPPEGISLMELAALADLLGLEGLKEVTSHALKTNYCHNFHKPCSGCIDGILQVLPVALNHALDDLYRKCLRWSCKHFMKVWPTRQFSQLSSDILARCRQQIVAYLTSESVLDTVLDWTTLLGQLSTYRWGSVCENLVRDILDASYAYIADHFASLIASDSFLSLGHDRSNNIPALENVLLRTASNLSADQACRSYQRITRLNTVLQAKIMHMPNMGELSRELQNLQEEELDWDPEYIRLVSSLLSAIEQCLIRQCSRAMRVTAWQRMDLDLRKKIQTLARLTEPLDLKRNNSKPLGKAFSFGGNTRNQDLYQVKLAIQAHSKKAMAQEAQLYKATQTTAVGNVQTAERGVQANHDVKEATSKVLKSNSRAHVPITIQNDNSETIHLCHSTERKNVTLSSHRRTKSEVPSTVTKIQNKENKVESTSKPKLASKLTDVRPRYLEPRKQRSSQSTGPVKSATTTMILTTQKTGNIHSSGSSRNTSPAARKGKSQERASNKSLDNLSSPSRRCRSSSRGKTAQDSDQLSDMTAESLAESMKSSIITNKTISQESLASGHKLSSSNPRLFTSSNKLVTIQNPKISNSEAKNVTVNNATLNKLRTLTCNKKISNGSSPSSVVTNKSNASRLSSVSSTQSSRELFKHRSISVPAAKELGDSNVSSSQHRYSFLSAKSREILAKRAEKNKQQKLQQEKELHNGGQAEPLNMQYAKTNARKLSNSANNTGNKLEKGPLRSASYSAVSTIMNHHQSRSTQPSNIPMRRPYTLISNQQRTAKTLQTQNKPIKSDTITNATNINNINQMNKCNFIKTNGNVPKSKKLIQMQSDLVIENISHKIDTDLQQENIEIDHELNDCKLERSSTFCKESADVDTNELHIIE